MSNKDYQEEHENLRKKIWSDAWVATASSSNCTTLESCTRYADVALNEFDRRFKKPSYSPDLRTKECPK